MPTSVKPEVVRELLERYAIAPPPIDTRFLSHADLDVGTPIEIRARIDPVRGPVIRASIDKEHAERAAPLSEDAAMEMVEHLRRQRLIPRGAHSQQTLAHLLVKAAHLFTQTGIDELCLGRVHVGPDGYHILEASMQTTKHITATARLDADAHDKGAVFTARRTGRRTGARK